MTERPVHKDYNIVEGPSKSIHADVSSWPYYPFPRIPLHYLIALVPMAYINGIEITDFNRYRKSSSSPTHAQLSTFPSRLTDTLGFVWCCSPQIHVIPVGEFLHLTPHSDRSETRLTIHRYNFKPPRLLLRSLTLIIVGRTPVLMTHNYPSTRNVCVGPNLIFMHPSIFEKKR